MTISVRPGNPYDFSEEELQDLAHRLEGASSQQVEIEVREERGYGVAWEEVIRIVIEHGDALAIWGRISPEVVSWLRGRWKRDEAEEEGPSRTRTAVIYGPDEKPLKTVKIEGKSGELLENEGET